MDFEGQLASMHCALSCSGVDCGEAQQSLIALMSEQEQEAAREEMMSHHSTGVLHHAAPAFAYYHHNNSHHQSEPPYLHPPLFQVAPAFHTDNVAALHNNCRSSSSKHFVDPELNMMQLNENISKPSCYFGSALLTRNQLLTEARQSISASDLPSAASSSKHELNGELETLRARILAHPHYPRLACAYMNCQKVGAPPEIVARLEEQIKEYQNMQPMKPSLSVGMDPELDQFMENYHNMLVKYNEELTRPLKEAMAFLRKIELQLSNLNKGSVRLSQTGEMNGNVHTMNCSSEEDDGSCCDLEYHELDPLAEEHKLKEHLLRKYSGYIPRLKQEFMKKKKKGKLPKEARQKLMEWWTQHYKWPYPSENEKAFLAESTGLDPKQINNWFINQRKRHWKPTEDLQYATLGSPSSHTLQLTEAIIKSEANNIPADQ